MNFKRINKLYRQIEELKERNQQLLYFIDDDNREINKMLIKANMSKLFLLERDLDYEYRRNN